jgi:hypothetical protein
VISIADRISSQGIDILRGCTKIRQIENVCMIDTNSLVWNEPDE